MRIVGDTCADVFSPQFAGLNVHRVPLTFTLDGKVYRGGIDIDSEGFYRLIAATTSFPTTSQPSVGDFAEVYRELAKKDPEIISIHVASALSGTYNSAVAAVELVPEAHVTVIDSKTVSGPLGWLLESAGLAAKAGWSREQIVALVNEIAPQTSFIFTVPTLRYLIHGGRISHWKGLLGTALGVKPIIGIDNQTGKLTPAGQARTMKAAIETMAQHIAVKTKTGEPVRTQILHGNNPEAVKDLHDMLDKRFNCTWLPAGAIAPVLGAHTGPGVVGVFFAPMSAFAKVPGNPWQ